MRERLAAAVLWDKLWHYSHIKIAIFASWTVLVLPLIVDAVNYAHAVLENGALSASDNSSVQRLIIGNLYFSSLLVVIANFFAKNFCPEIIQQYPRADDYFEHKLAIREKINRAYRQATGAASNNVAAFPASDEKMNLIDRIANVFIREIGLELGKPAVIYEEWNTENRKQTAFRLAIGGLYAIGVLGIIIYLAWRTTNNIDIMTRLLGG